MAKYKVKNTSILHNKKVYAEGSIVELNEQQAERLEDFVELINEALISKSNKNNQSKTVKMTVKASTNPNENFDEDTSSDETNSNDGGETNDN